MAGGVDFFKTRPPSGRGGVLAVFVAPERVIVFAGTSDGTPTWLALLKGSWLALASGYVIEDGLSGD
jgi:hypothetical protein